MAKSNEPIWWSLFAAGGVVAALFLPATMFITGFAIPTGLIDEHKLFDLIHHPLTRLYLFVVIAFPLFHGAHRSLFTLIDLGLKEMRSLLAVLLYGGAVAGTVIAAWLLIRM
jgi:fumarate reductase subunit D